MATRYRFCPQCGVPLQHRHRHGRMRPVCDDCGHVVFIDPKVAVVAVVSQRGLVLLVRRAHEPGRGKWALPGGFVDADEMPADALVREVAEETGVLIEAGKIAGVFPLVSAEDGQSGFVLAFSATVAAEDVSVPIPGDDAVDARWWAPQDVPEDLAFESTRSLLETWAAEQAELLKRAGSPPSIKGQSR